MNFGFIWPHIHPAYVIL